MSKLAILFWIACVATIVWCGVAFVGIGVGATYHPMAANGDLLFPLRLMAVGFAIVAAFVMYFVWMRRRPLSSRAYLIGLAVLAAIAVLPILPRIDSGYEQTYFVGDQRHDIPWEYDPSGGDVEPGGRYFRVRAALPDLGETYRAMSQSIFISKAVDFDFGRGGEAPAETCEVDTYSTRCEWQQGDFVYSVSGDNDNFPQDSDKLMADVARLVDGFVVLDD